MTTPLISVALPPSNRVVDYAQAAEGLGYHRVWLYDSPAVYGDVWIALALIAQATARIGLGTGVAVPSLRHPMVTASAISTIERLAPGRLVAAFGTGFTARTAMGQPSMRWADLGLYVRQLRALLAGDVVDIDGRACQMLHADGWGAARPITVPLWVAPTGPKGFRTAHEISADGVMLVDLPPAGEVWPRAAMIVHGTVVRDGEHHTSERILEAAGPWFATTFHALWEISPDLLDAVPGGAVWRDQMEVVRPEPERHLAVHEGHITVLTERDRAGIAAAGSSIMDSGWTGDAASIRSRLEQTAAGGVIEVVYTPAGPAIIDELESFAQACSIERK